MQLNSVTIFIIFFFFTQLLHAEKAPIYKQDQIVKALQKLEEILTMLKNRQASNPLEKAPHTTTIQNVLKTKTTVKTATTIQIKQAKVAKDEGGELEDDTGNNGKVSAAAPAATGTPGTGECVPDACPKPECKKLMVLNKNTANDANITKFGKVLTACEGIYFFSNVSMTYEHASHFCCSIGLRLGTLESGPKLNCLARVYRDTIKADGVYWTSATFNKCTKKFWWCQDKLNVISSLDMLRSVTKEYLTPKACLKFLINKRDQLKCSMIVGYCREKLNFMCQQDEIVTTTTENPVCVKPECPKLSACPQFKKASSIDRYTALPTGCGKQLFLSTFEANLQDASKACCDLGMRLLSVETKQKRECLVKLTKGVKMEKEILAGGSDLGCRNTWNWCGSDTLFSNSTTWDYGEPAKWFDVYRCAYFNTELGKKFSIRSQPCYKTKTFICEVNA